MHESSPRMPAMPQQTCFRQKAKQPLLLLLMGYLVLALQGYASTPPAPNSSEAAHAQAETAYLAKDYKRTISIVEPLARAGESWAQYTLGYMYHFGRGVAMDRKLARVWIERAAKQGYVPAQAALRRMPVPQPRHGNAANSPARPPPGDVKGPETPAEAMPRQQQEPIPPTARAAAGVTSSRPDNVTPETTAVSANSAEQSETAVQPRVPPAPHMAGTESSPAASASSASPQTTIPAATTEASVSQTPSEGSPSPPQSMAKIDLNGVKGRNWIAAQDPQHYTVQILGSSNETAVLHFIHKQGIESRAAYYATLRNGQPWFSVIYGSFPSRAAARQAVQALPPSMRNDSPWLRSFSDIRTALDLTR